MPPLTLMIKPASSLCNMRCSYCFYGDVAARREAASYGMMSEETLDKLLRRAFTYAQGELNIAFQGGEPTLAGKDFFRAFLALEERYNTRRIRVNNSIQTNGYALDREWAALFAKGRFLVGVSVDGSQAIHDGCRADAQGRPTFARIAQNLALLREAGVDYNILCVVHQAVAAAPQAVFDTLKGHGYVQFIPCLDGFDGEKHAWSLDPVTYGRFLIETYDLYERAIYAGRPVSIRTFDNWLTMLLGQPPESCAMAGRCGQYFLIEADGSAYPCDFYVLDEWKLGNVLDASFFKLEKSPVAKAFREASYPLPPPCRECAYLHLCRGGCKRDREPIREGRSSPNRLCEGHKLFFAARLARMQALARHIGRTYR